MRYFRIEDSFTASDRWYLKSPETSEGDEIDPRLFTEGREYKGHQSLRIPLRRGTRSLDFTLGIFDMPVVKQEVGERIQGLSPTGIQRIPAKVIGDYGWYEILNVLTVKKAINEELSEIKWWTEAMGIPDKVGQYFGIGKLVLNQEEVAEAEIFRLQNWPLPLVVSESVKNLLEEMNISGISFLELTVVP